MGRGPILICPKHNTPRRMGFSGKAKKRFYYCHICMREDAERRRRLKGPPKKGGRPRKLVCPKCGGPRRSYRTPLRNGTFRLTFYCPVCRVEYTRKRRSKKQKKFNTDRKFSTPSIAELRDHYVRRVLSDHHFSAVHPSVWPQWLVDLKRAQIICRRAMLKHYGRSCGLSQ